jgi:hypothetical protein
MDAPPNGPAERLEVSLNFMPAFYTRHLGVKYGEGYYFDPGYRAEIERAEERFLFEVLGKYGVGSREPRPSPNAFIQPVDLVMRTQGAEWRFPEDATVETWGAPWARLSPAEIEAIDPRAAAGHPVIDAMLAQYRELERRYGAAADLFWSKSGAMVIHTPYTTAHQLCGEELFVTMLTEPDVAGLIFAKVWAIYQAIFARITAVTGARLNRIHLGDCSASLLSADTYRDVVLPVNQQVAAQFEHVGYHSCGGSSHLLAHFHELPKLESIQLGPGTDLAASARLLPGIRLQPIVDPLLMRQGTPDTVASAIAGVLKDTAPAPAVTLCAWSFDRDTPIPNVAAMYEATRGPRT